MQKITELDGLEAARWIQQVNWNVYAYGVLRASFELGVYDAVAAGHETVEALAKACHAHPEELEKLLIACAAEGWLVKAGDRFLNSAAAMLCLVEGSPMYQGNSIRHGTHTAEHFINMAPRIRTEEQRADEADWHHSFIWAMHDIAITGPAQAVAQNVDFSACRSLLDVGGGPGTYSIAICEVWPRIRAVVFDLPQTLAHTRRNIERYGMADRISVREGDWDEDEFGEGVDAVLMSNVLHGYGSGALVKLAKAWRALAPGGLLVVHDFFLDEHRDGPPVAASFNLWIGAFDGGEIRRLLAEAGFAEAGFVAGGSRGRGILTARKPAQS